MGDMIFPFSKRGCTTEKISRARYLYMFGGRNTDGFGYPGAEYIDLQEYPTLGFNESYYNMGGIIDRAFKLQDPHDWYAPNCFPSQYAQDIIYCGGGYLKNAQAGGLGRNAEIWLFERIYQFNTYDLGSTLNSDPLYSCTKKSNNFGPPYLQYPECGGLIGYQVGQILSRGYPQEIDTTTAPRTFVSGCMTPWISFPDMTNGDFGIKFYIGGLITLGVNARNALVIREDEESYFYTSNPTPGTSRTPTSTPTKVPTDTPSMQTEIPSKTPSNAPSISPSNNSTGNITLQNPTNTPIVSPTDSNIEQYNAENVFAILSIIIGIFGTIVAIIGIIHAKCFTHNELFQIMMVIIPFFYLYVCKMYYVKRYLFVEYTLIYILQYIGPD